MTPENEQPTRQTLAAFERPALIVMTVCQMLLGLGLGVVLALKIYMLVFTDQSCATEGTTLGNMIRCTPTLVLLAQFLFLAAGFRIAALFFTPAPFLLIEPLVMVMVGVLLLFLSGLGAASDTWYLPLILVALLSGVGALFAARMLWHGR